MTEPLSDARLEGLLAYLKDYPNADCHRAAQELIEARAKLARVLEIVENDHRDRIATAAPLAMRKIEEALNG